MPNRISRICGILFALSLCAAWPARLSGQSSDLCKNERARQAWDDGSDPVYADAKELAVALREHSFVVDCILSSKQQSMVKGQRGAAWFKTDQGIFDVWFLPKGQTFDALESVEQSRQDGRYLYSFRGTPESRSEDSSKQIWFIKHENMLFHVWGNKQLAVSLAKAFEKP
jgi:hypothetical protein